MNEKVRVKDFLMAHNKGCPKKASVYALGFNESSEGAIIFSLVTVMGECLAEKADIATFKERVREKAEKFVGKMNNVINWKPQKDVERYVNLTARLYAYCQTSDIASVDVNVPAEYGDFVENVSFILHYTDGGHEAYIVEMLNYDRVSPVARNDINRMEYNLKVLIAEYYLGKTYPDDYNEVKLCFLQSSKYDKGYPEQLPELRYSTIYGKSNGGATADDNVMYCHEDVVGIIKGGKTDMSEVERRIGIALELNSVESVPDCAHCSSSEFCHIQSMDAAYYDMTSTVKEQKEYFLPSFSSEQKEAIRHIDGPLSVIAGPGSGKTATLVGRTCQIIYSGVSPLNILLCTFTRKAAEEISSRISAVLGRMKAKQGGRRTRDSIVLPTVTTLNAFSFTCLKEHVELLNEQSLRVMTDQDKVGFAIDVMNEFGEPMQDINYNSLFASNGFMSTIVKALDVYIANKDHPERLDSEWRAKKWTEDMMVIVKKVYEKKEEHGFITFDEQVSLCAKMFREHPEVAEEYRKKYPYIIVDEYQDTNDITADMLYALAGENPNLCVVGDDDQSIYAFRGGSCKHLVDFSKRFENAKTIYLKTNYRCTNQIVSIANRITALIDGRQPKMIEAVSDGPVPEIYRIEQGDELFRVCEYLKKKHDEEDVSYGDMAVLCKTNASLVAMREYMQANGIPAHMNKAYVVTDQVFGMFFTALKIALYGTGAKGVEEGIYKSLMALNDKKTLQLNIRAGNVYRYILDKLHMPELTDYHYYAHDADAYISEINASEDEGVRGYGYAVFLFIVFSHMHEFVKVRTECTSADFIDEFFGFAGVENHVLKTYLMQRMEDNDELQELCALHKNLDSLVVYNDTTQRISLSASESVTLCTYHDAKGLEWNTVVARDINGFNINGDTLEKIREQGDELRNLYVGLTRAKKNLLITYVPGKKATDKIPQFISAIESGIADELVIEAQKKTEKEVS